LGGHVVILIVIEADRLTTNTYSEPPFHSASAITIVGIDCTDIKLVLAAPFKKWFFGLSTHVDSKTHRIGPVNKLFTERRTESTAPRQREEIQVTVPRISCDQEQAGDGHGSSVISTRPVRLTAMHGRRIPPRFGLQQCLDHGTSSLWVKICVARLWWLLHHQSCPDVSIA
jgi:hypothetical protein